MLSTLATAARRGLVRRGTVGFPRSVPYVASEAALYRATARSVAPRAAVSAAFPSRARGIASSAPAHVAASHASWAAAAPTTPLLNDAGAASAAGGPGGATGAELATAIASLRGVLESRSTPEFDMWGYSLHAQLMFDFLCCLVKHPRFLLPVRDGAVYGLKDASGGSQLYAFTTEAQFQRFKDELVASAVEGEDLSGVEAKEVSGVAVVGAVVQAVRADRAASAAGTAADGGNDSEPTTNVTLHIDVRDEDNSMSIGPAQTDRQLEHVAQSMGVMNLVQQLSRVPGVDSVWDSPDFAGAMRQLRDFDFYLVSVLPKDATRFAELGGAMLSVHVPSNLVVGDAAAAEAADTDAATGGDASKTEYKLATVVFTHPTPAAVFLRHHGRGALAGKDIDQYEIATSPLPGSALFSLLDSESNRKQAVLAHTLMFDPPCFRLGTPEGKPADIDDPDSPQHTAYGVVLKAAGPSVVASSNAALCTLDTPSGKWIQEAEARGLWSVPNDEAAAGGDGAAGAV